MSHVFQRARRVQLSAIAKMLMELHRLFAFKLSRSLIFDITLFERLDYGGMITTARG